MTPGQIAAEWEISLDSVLGYLDQKVARGVIRRSDILFSLSPEARQSPVTMDDQKVVERYGSAAHALGDMYEEIRAIESTLHERIRSALVQQYGAQETGWWHQGLPESIRKKCAARREEDGSPLDAYRYTDLLDLSEILNARWSLLNAQVGRLGSDKQRLLKELGRLNEIRKMVMHPVRGAAPDEEDFQFLRKLREELGI